MNKEPVRVLTPSEMYATKWWESEEHLKWRAMANCSEPPKRELPCLDLEEKIS